MCSAYKHQLEQAQAAYKAAKQALTKLHHQAMTEAPRDSVDKRTNKTLHEVFAEYPDTEREVEDLIDDVEAQLGVLHTQKGAKANYDKARKDLAAAIESRDDLQNATEHNVQRFEQRKVRARQFAPCAPHPLLTSCEYQSTLGVDSILT